MSYETRYAAMMDSKRERIRNSPEAVEEHRKIKDALSRAYEDTVKKYYPLTAENVAVNGPAAILYQQERIEFWRKELGV